MPPKSKLHDRRLIYDICSGTGAWSAPYKEAGYEVYRIDLPIDVRLVGWHEHRIHGILAAPPCTVFANSGNRWHRSPKDYLQAISVVDACLRLVTIYQPAWWVLENPTGKLVRWLGPPKMYFNPCDYGDPYTKKTALWGSFNPPQKTPVKPLERSPIHHEAPGPYRVARRSATPPGFARAFFEANP